MLECDRLSINKILVLSIGFLKTISQYYIKHLMDYERRYMKKVLELRYSVQVFETQTPVAYTILPTSLIGDTNV